MSALAMRRKGLSLAVWLGTATLTVVMVLLVAAIARTMRSVEPVRATVPPVSAVVWGDRVFFKPPALAHWLKFRGVHYQVWAKRHPPANRLLRKHVAKPKAG